MTLRRPPRTLAGPILATVLVTVACLFRLLLTLWHWPPTDGDEGTMGLAALHIAQATDFPILFYGQWYMGVPEAYLAAPVFHLVGPSDYTLRLVAVALFAGFLVATYLLATLLYSRFVAVITLLLLALGSREMLKQELLDLGGYQVLLCAGSWGFLLACRLAIVAPADGRTRERAGRYMLYAAWGVICGLGVWSDLLFLPWMLASGVLLVLRCWRELLGPPLTVAVAGLLLGSWPLIAHNLAAPPGLDSLSVLRAQSGGLYAPLQQLAGFVLVSLPFVTGGNAVCTLDHFAAWPLDGTASTLVRRCTAVHAVWSLGLLVAWASAAISAALCLWELRTRVGDAADRRARSVQTARLLLLAGAGLTALLFIRNPVAHVAPHLNYRYVLGVLVAAPAIVAPLASLLDPATQSPLRRSGCGALALGCLCVVFAIGAVGTLQDAAAWHRAHEDDALLLRDLQRHAETHIYSGYDQCAAIMVETAGKVRCSALGSDLRPGLNRYPRDGAPVLADPRAVYVFLSGGPEDLLLRAAPGFRRRSVRHSYVVYEPRAPLPPPGMPPTMHFHAQRGITIR